METKMIQNIPTFVNKQIENKFSQFKGKVDKTMECEKELMEFEILASIVLKPQKKIHEGVKEERSKAWNEALKKANGNKEKAIEIFDETYLK